MSADPIGKFMVLQLQQKYKLLDAQKLEIPTKCQVHLLSEITPLVFFRKF